MCLINAVPYDGNKKIIAYKVLRKRNKNAWHNSTWFSSLSFDYYFYKTDGSVQKASGEFMYDPKYKTVYGGVFHAFCKKEDALEYAEDLKRCYKSKAYVIAKCEFPKGCEHVFFGQQKYLTRYTSMKTKDSCCGEKMKILEIEEFKNK